MQRALAALLLLAVLASSVQAEVDPHPRTSPAQTLAGPVTAFAMAGNGAVAAGMNDTGRTIGQSATVATWTWWDAAGLSLRSDRADEANCPTITPFNACIGDVTGLALSADGSRLAVVARGDSENDGRLLLFNAQSGPIQSYEYTNEHPTSVAMSRDGTRVAVGLVRPQSPAADLGRVRAYSWPNPGNSPSAAWSVDLGFPVKEVAVGADNRVAAIGSDRSYRFNSGGTATYTHDTDAPLNAVAAAAAGPAHWSVVGANDGGVLLYSDGQDTANPTAAYDLQPGTSPQRAVAIANDARHFAAGDAAGVVRLFRNPDLVTGPAPIAQTPALDGAVTSLRFTDDGSLLQATAGRGTYLFRASDSGLSEIWRAVGTTAILDGGMSADGEYVASASGSAVTVYTAVHKVTASVPSGLTVAPGQPKLVTMTFTNTGNRDETVPLTVSKPADWAANTEPSSVVVPAGGTATAQLNVTAPAFAGPGSAAVEVTHRVRGIPTVTSVPFTVQQVRSWTVTADGALSRSVDAGASVRMPVKVQNLGNGADTSALTATVDLPGWTATVSPASLSLAKGATGSAEVTVTAPADAAQGSIAKVAVAVAADASASLQLTATVGARFGVSAAATPAQGDGDPGKPHSFTVRVTNAGNAPDSFRVVAGDVPAGWTLSVAEAPLAGVVQPGQGVDVGVTVTPSAQANAGTYRLTVRAESLGDPSRTATATHDLLIDGSSETSKTGGSKGGPGLPLLGVLAAVAVAVALQRRLR